MFCTSCGKELKEGTAFCTRCGKPVKGINSTAYTLKKETDTQANQETNQETDKEIKQESDSGNNSSGTVENNYNTNRYQSLNSGYNSGMNNNYQNNQNYGQYNNGYQNNQNNGQYNNSYQNNRQYNKGYSLTPHQIYKRRVLPFKIVSAVLNLFALFVLWMIGIVAVAVGSDSYKEYRHNWITGFEVYGYITVILGLVLFVFIILGFALPAKAGVSFNLITTITCITFLIWGMVKYGVMLSKVNRYIHSLGYVSYYSEDAQSLAIGAMVFCVIAIFFQIISFVFSCLGLATKKNYTNTYQEWK